MLREHSTELVRPQHHHSKMDRSGNDPSVNAEVSALLRCLHSGGNGPRNIFLDRSDHSDFLDGFLHRFDRNGPYKNDPSSAFSVKYLR
ncbi:MAG: hypothetical protein ABI878_10795 [Acidobacteriota bacterium]